MSGAAPCGAARSRWTCCARTQPMRRRKSTCRGSGGGLGGGVEISAGASAGFPDQKFAESGAKVAADRADLFAADVILQVRAGGADLDRFRQGQVVIGTCDPLGDPQTSQAIAARGVTLFALEMLPRIARAQSMDVLSS